MTLLELARLSKTNTDIFVQMHNNKNVWLEISEKYEKGIVVGMTTRGAVGEVRDLLSAMRGCDILEQLEVYLQSRLWGQGPKIFRPTAEQLFALEQMNLNVEVADFHLPFEMIAIELPEAYRITKKDSDGEIPHVSLLYREPTMNFFAHDLLYPRTALKAYWRGQPDETLEEWLDFDYKQRKPVGTIETTIEEYTSEAQVRRAVLNFCLLLDEVGIKANGPQHPNQYNQLVKWCAKNNQHTASNKRQLQAQPHTFSLAKPEVQLIRYVSSEAELPGEQPGWKVKPHCRRGHYRNQPTRQGVKRIRIAPVFVNAHLMTVPIGGAYST